MSKEKVFNVLNKSRSSGLRCATKAYDFYFFGGRASVTDNKETKYISEGTNEV